jgi:prephenate dehydrogenase
MADSLADCVQGANLVVVGVPVGSVVAVVREILPLLLPGTVVTDLGSTKQTIVSALRKTPPGVTFVGGHPLAGSEESGPRAARADLFQGCRVILTPMPATPLPVIEQLSSWWRSLGAGQITSLSPKEHDRIVAAISHVPHLLAAALASATPAETLPWAASGWKDTTRIAAGPVDVWNDIFLANRKNLLHGLANVERVLASFRKTLENNGQEHRLKLLLKKAKDQRDAVAD